MVFCKFNNIYRKLISKTTTTVSQESEKTKRYCIKTVLAKVKKKILD